MKFDIKEKSKLLSDKGMECCFNGEYEKGLQYFDEGLKDDPNSILLLYNKAGCLVSLGEMEKSKVLFKKIIKLCDRYAKTELVLNIKANSYTYLRDFDSAHDVFEEILKYFPQNEDALVSRAVCFKRNGEFDNAFECLDKVLELDSYNFEANMYKAELCLDLGKKEESREYIDRIYELNPNYPYVLYLKGYYHAIVTSDYQKAISYLRRATNLEPNFEKCYFEMGKIHILLGNADEAKKCFKQISSYRDDETSDKYLEGITEIFSSYADSD